MMEFKKSGVAIKIATDGQPGMSLDMFDLHFKCAQGALERHLGLKEYPDSLFIYSANIPAECICVETSEYKIKIYVWYGWENNQLVCKDLKTGMGVPITFTRTNLHNNIIEDIE